MTSLTRLATLSVLALACVAPALWAQAPPLDEEILHAPVEIDGVVLFPVCGTSAFPAEKRAAELASRILGLARDRGFQADGFRRIEAAPGILIVGGPIPVMTVTDTDARVLGLNRQEFADACVRRISQAIEEYRSARRP